MFLDVIDENLYDDEIFDVATAIGGYEDKNMDPVSPIAAALVLGDKNRRPSRKNKSQRHVFD